MSKNKEHKCPSCGEVLSESFLLSVAAGVMGAKSKRGFTSADGKALAARRWRKPETPEAPENPINCSDCP